MFKQKFIKNNFEACEIFIVSFLPNQLGLTKVFNNAKVKQSQT